MYWLVAVVNLALRFMWTITLMPENPQNSDGFFGRDLQVHVSPFIAAAEIIRRYDVYDYLSGKCGCDAVISSWPFLTLGVVTEVRLGACALVSVT